MEIYNKVYNQEENKNLDLLLIHCPCWDVENPPFGSLCIYNYLKHKNYKIKLFDLNIEIFQESNKKEIWESNKVGIWFEKKEVKKIFNSYQNIIKKTLNEIKKYRPKIIGMSITGSNHLFSNMLAEEIKKYFPSQIIIAGGNGVYSIGDIQNIIDKKKNYEFLVIGEGEKTIELIINSIDNPEKIKKINNLYLLKESPYFKGVNFDGEEIVSINYDDFVKTKVNYEQVPEINELTKFNIPENLKLFPYKNNYSMGIFFSRGCIGKCTFCNDTKRWKHFRIKKAEIVFEEIKYYHEKYNVSNFQFHDLILNANLKELEKFCDMIITSSMNINWHGFFRIHPNLTSELCKKLKKSGCKTINIGVDNFSQKILDKMKKLYTQEDIINNLKLLHENELIYGINYITGYPGETEDNFKEELEFLDKYHKYIPQIYALGNLHINQGTEIYDNRDQNNIILPIGHLQYNKWYLKDNSNNPEIRVARLNRFKQKCDDYNIPIDFINP